MTIRSDQVLPWPRSTWLVRLGVLPLLVLVQACGGSSPPPEEPDDRDLGVAKFADLSRCEYKGRKDRVFTSTRGPGASVPNVYRVYDVSVDAENGRRVLRCRLADTDFDGILDVIRTYTEDGKPLDEQSDADYDGRIDTWVSYSRGRVLRQSHDRNRDGKPDEWKTYSGGHLARVQRDASHDGKVDTWEVYEQGRLRRLGRDTDGDQRVDQWYRDATKKPDAVAPIPTAVEAAAPSAPPQATPTATAAPASSAPEEKP